VNKSACQCKAGVQLSLGPLVLRGRVALRLLCRVLQADAIAHGRLDPLGTGCRGGAQPTLRLSAVPVSPRKLAPYFEPSFAVSFGLGWCCLCESHCVTSPQACLACPRGGYCDGKLNRPVPIQGRQTPADLWGPKVRLPVESCLWAGYTFGRLLTPGNGTSSAVLPIVECHSKLACAGGQTSAQCFQGYTDTRLPHKPAPNLPRPVWLKAGLRHPPENSSTAHSSDGSAAGVARAMSATMGCRDTVMSVETHRSRSFFPAASQLLESWGLLPFSSGVVHSLR
jgi:hypothetical protein